MRTPLSKSREVINNEKINNSQQRRERIEDKAKQRKEVTDQALKMPSSPQSKDTPRSEKSRAHLRQEPKPKFVAHKPPQAKSKGKEKTTSNRLGGSHMA